MLQLYHIRKTTKHIYNNQHICQLPKYKIMNTLYARVKNNLERTD